MKISSFNLVIVSNLEKGISPSRFLWLQNILQDHGGTHLTKEKSKIDKSFYTKKKKKREKEKKKKKIYL